MRTALFNYHLSTIERELSILDFQGKVRFKDN